MWYYHGKRKVVLHGRKKRENAQMGCTLEKGTNQATQGAGEKE